MSTPDPEPSTYTGPERRSRMRERQWRDDVDRRFADGSAKMKALHDELKANTETTNRVDTNTSELVSLLNSFKGAFKVLDILGRAAKPLSYIAMFGSAAWGLFTAIKGGGEPPK